MAKKKQPGRPEKPKSQKRDYRLVVKLTEAERKAIKSAADGDVSGWVRDILLAHAGGKK
jgi:hypothetical protein